MRNKTRTTKYVIHFNLAAEKQTFEKKYGDDI